MAINWGEVLKYFGQGVSQAGTTVGTAIVEAPEKKRKAAIEEITLSNQLAERKRKEKAMTALGQYQGKMAEPASFTKARDLTQSELDQALRTGQDPDALSPQYQPSKRSIAESVGLPTMQDTEAVKNLMSGITSEEAKTTEFERQKKLQTMEDAAALERTKIMAASQKERNDATISAKKEIAGKTPNPTLQKVKDARLEKFINVVEENKLKLPRIIEAETAVNKIPTGMIGKGITKYYEAFDPKNPVLGEWQKLKRVLTDAQLMNTAKTKGAISDKEMELFAKAAAADEMVSPRKVKIILKALREDATTNEKAQAISYSKLYKEDPYMIIGEAEAPTAALTGGATVGKYQVEEVK